MSSGHHLRNRRGGGRRVQGDDPIVGGGFDQALEVTHRAGIEIDICPKCRGIWLDRGELDRLAGPPTEPINVETQVPSPGRSDELAVRHRTRSKRGRLVDRLSDALEEVLDL